MGIISEKDTTYWMPDFIPESSNEYNQNQKQKRYLTNLDTERVHPGWHYDNGALVDDEYLFQNEGWRLILDSPPQEELFKRVVRDEVDPYLEIDDKTVEINYVLVDFTQEQINTFINGKWASLRQKRNLLLSDTDWLVLIAYENNIEVSNELKNYRQQLRDFPETIQDILNFDIDNAQNWPTKPEIL
jgi:hypothetical protein